MNKMRSQWWSDGVNNCCKNVLCSLSVGDDLEEGEAQMMMGRMVPLLQVSSGPSQSHSCHHSTNTIP